MDYGQPVRFGVFLTPDGTLADRSLTLAALADQLGFDVIGVQDHPYQRRFLDTWTLLTAIAMRTEKVHVFPDVANLPLRPPAVLAKAAASLDLLTGGRAELGLGAGGFWEAIKAMGGPVRTPGESVAALEEAIQVVRLMWSGERNVRFDGKFYQLAGVQTGPKPAHPIGIWLGAYKPRMLSLVGRAADGWVPSLGYFKPADLLEGNRRIDDAAGAAGRDPRSIRRILNVGADVSVELFTSLTVEHGMDTFVVGGIEDPESLRWFASDVIPTVREEVAKAR
ncbi:MAG TPA: LLM class flavin-dependent oxidoreductase [Candidatus Dormibacteraeota bacterium]|nr:LLM class flavin-dependent oxidoreductase [Candidatus Dormibacteraeota bacterium]